MPAEKWEDFPVDQIVGKNFVLHEQSIGITTGRIYSVVLETEKQLVKFYAYGMEEYPICSFSMNSASWEQATEFILAVNIRGLGTLTIYLR